MTKTREGEGKVAGRGIPYASKPFLQIEITVGTGNLWLSNVAAALFHQTLLKVLPPVPFKMIPRLNEASNKTV